MLQRHAVFFFNKKKVSEISMGLESVLHIETKCNDLISLHQSSVDLIPWLDILIMDVDLAKTNAGDQWRAEAGLTK